MDFEIFRDRVQTQLESVLDQVDAPHPLIDAMRYGVFNGGKRIRPALVYLTCNALDTHLSKADIPACSIELIHAYSLIHDDLPAMDDDDLRRGKPTCHIKYGEATAILAGDALQTLAFELLAGDEQLDSETRICLISELTRASGARGMVAGQAIDLASENTQIDGSVLESMHRRKTGDLINACLIFGAILSKASPETTGMLRQFGECLGLAFQIRDDILDVTGDTHSIGKPVGSDLENDKSTFVSVYGLAGAKDRLNLLLTEAESILSPLDDKAEPLREMARFVINRTH
jgi:geranylgeranyl diphosphate synthase, type II